METIYLAGGIAGLSDAECNDWRNEVMSALNGKYEFRNPMVRDCRDKYGPELSSYIVENDLKDIDESDIVLARAHIPSWGTGMEIIYAHQHDKIVFLINNKGQLHPWLDYYSHLSFSTESYAIYYLESRYQVLNKYNANLNETTSV